MFGAHYGYFAVFKYSCVEEGMDFIPIASETGTDTKIEVIGST